jgi:putative membrane protein
MHYAMVAAAAVALTACGGGGTQRTAGNTGANRQQSGTAERSAGSNLSGAERQFLTSTAESTMAGLQMAQMASVRASSAPVRSFAQQLASTCQSRLSQLQQIASSNGVTLPGDLSSADRARIDALSNTSGPQFDQAFLSAMVSEGQRDATAFALEASNGNDQGLKKFASDALPNMQARQQYAQGMLAQLRSGNASTANPNANPNYIPPPPQ